MPATFVLFIICFVIAVIAAVSWRFVKGEDGQMVTFIVAAAAAVFALVFAITASVNIVGTRQVGIVTSFGKPTGETLSNGLHIKAPWVKVSEMDAAIQNDVYNGDGRIQVRLGNDSVALADANVRWNIVADQADELFQQYKEFSNVRTNLIERNLRTSLNEAFIDYDPLVPDTDGKNNLSAVTKRALELLREKSGDQVQILDLSIPVIDYDDKTEERINGINQARAETTQATQQKETAEQRAEAARILANQPVPDLKISIAACVNKMAETGQNLNCFPIGSNVLPTLNVPNPAG